MVQEARIDDWIPDGRERIESDMRCSALHSARVLSLRDSYRAMWAKECLENGTMRIGFWIDPTLSSAALANVTSTSKHTGRSR